jgi:hypothetical protein
MSHASQCIAMCLSHFGCFMSPLTSLTPSILGSGWPGGMSNFGGRSSQLPSLLPYRYRVSEPASKTHRQIYLCTLLQTFENCMRSLIAGSDCSHKQALTCVALTREHLLICTTHNAIQLVAELRLLVHSLYSSKN